jgi:IclR family acetate operon transcriptional repressor
MDTAIERDPAARAVGRTLTSAGHVLQALQVVSEHPQGVAIKCVARRLGVSLSSAYAVMASLLDQGLVESSPVTPGLYTVGPKVAHLYASYVAARHRPERLQPTAEQLRDRASARSYVAVWDDGDLEISYVRGRRGSCELQDVSAGFRGAAHALAIGKALLAWTPERTWPEYLRDYRYAPYTEHTVTAPIVLRRHLADIRKAGIAFDIEEFRLGVSCVAAPVRDSANRVVAAIGVSVSARRFAQDREALFEAVHDVAVASSQNLPALFTRPAVASR